MPKATASAFWARIHRGSSGGGKSATAQLTAPNTLDRGLTGLWLDAKVHANLNESVPLIGAP